MKYTITRFVGSTLCVQQSNLFLVLIWYTTYFRWNSYFRINPIFNFLSLSLWYVVIRFLSTSSMYLKLVSSEVLFPIKILIFPYNVLLFSYLRDCLVLKITHTWIVVSKFYILRFWLSRLSSLSVFLYLYQPFKLLEKIH